MSAYKIILYNAEIGDQQYIFLSPNSFSLADARGIAKTFRGKTNWYERRQDVWSNGHIILSIRLRSSFE